ncbi:MAG TPA: TonB-dependent receptor [Vicinamibacterales bacterium]
MSRRMLAVMVLFAFAAGPAWAQSAPSPQHAPSAGAAQPASGDQPEQDEAPVYEEQLVVTASRTEQTLVNAPATVTLISGETIEAAAATGYADVFRSVPGLNVTQTSARDINLTARGASGTLSTSQLALVDGRSIYLDFFGFIAWDFLPVNPAEIKQIEVIRGPASAVWGANAMNGVVNVITRSPRELQGTTVTMGVGGFGRTTSFTPAGQSPGAGSLFYVNGSHARAVNDRWAYKISAGVYSQDPLARPSGAIPNGTGTTYPDFVNTGTTQPKIDVRADYDFADGRRKLIFQGGVAGTEGILHSGIGPFDIDTGTVLGYGKVNYRSGGFRLNAFTNILQGDATNLLAVGVNGQPLTFDFGSRTFDVEVGDVRAWRGRHVFSYGGNFRVSTFDLSIAPEGDSRAEGGVYAQDEIFLGEHVRWIVGGRVDKFDVIDNVQFSPRTTLMFKPDAAQTIRLSYNRAYRAPSVINQYLDTAIINQLPLGSINPLLAGRVFNFPVRAVGSNIGLAPAVPAVDLTEQSITAYEIGYTGVIRQRATVSAAFFINETKDDIFFTQVASYRAASPPPGWSSTGLPLVVLDLLYCPPGTTPSAQRPCPFGVGNGLPAAFSYRNLGKVRQKGFEVGIDGALTREWSAYANYSYQPEPEAIGFPQSELNLPPANRFNAGVHYGGDRFLGGLTLSYQDEAFWQDVLDSRYSGPTEAFTLLNGSFGIRWGRERKVVTTIRATNLLNDDIQQHVFGDVSKLQVVGELRVGF